MACGRLIAFALLSLLLCGDCLCAELREAVHPRRNVEQFPAVTAKYIRFTVQRTNRGEPGIDELEIYGPDDASRNLALAANGARASSSGALPGYQIHELQGLNDGLYGNGHCWIADRTAGAWVQIELPRALRIDKIVWSRDREGKFTDRVATEYAIKTALVAGEWHEVASSADRKPFENRGITDSLSPVTRQFVNRFAPVSTTLSPDAERASSDYTIDSWQTPDGLPANTVTAISQSPDGYLWIGTLNGLARFDGIRFKVFGKAEGLLNNRVLCLLFDRLGALWIGTDGGGLFRYQSGFFTIYQAKDGLDNNAVRALAEDSEGRIWIGTAEGIRCLKDGRFLRDPKLIPTYRTPVSRLLVDGNQVWTAENGGVYILQNGVLERPPNPGEPSWFSSIFAFHRGPSGKIWFGGANNYVSCLSNKTVSVFPEQAGQLLDTIWELLETRSGDVWVGTASGGLRRLRDGHFTSLTTQEGLSDNSVRCLFEDREGSLWVGTVGGGINRVKQRRATTFTTRDGLSHNVIMSLAEDNDGTLWIGSNCGGLNTRKNGRISPYGEKFQLDNQCIWSLVTARDGSLWIGTWGGGLFHKQGEEITPLSLARGGNDQPVVALCEDRSGALWIGTYSQGLKLLRNGTVTQVTSNQLSANFVTAIVEDGEKALWVGTGGGGLNHIQFTATNEEDAPLPPFVVATYPGLPNDFVRTLFLDSAGVLWIGTDGGLARLENGHLTVYTRAQGLPDEVISQILDDHSGNLWLGSNRGIFRIARRELEAIASGSASALNVVAYGRADGMENAQCTGGFYPAGLRTRDGKLWFSTVKGLVMVDPAAVPRNDLPPRVIIESLRLNGEAIPQHEHIRVAHPATRLDIQFTATSLAAPEKNRFRHRLEGLERDWIEDAGQRAVTYHRVPPGNYRFQVAACNGDGVWNLQGASLQLSVLPPFWQTWWFATVAGAAVLGGGGWGVRYWSVRRLRRKLRVLQEQHALEKERARIAQDIHDELGASLTSIALLTELGQKHKEQSQEVSADLGKISATAREAVRAMDAIVWAVNPRNDSLDHFANYVSQFAEDFFRLTPIRYRLNVPPDLPERPLSTEARHNLFLAVKESLNNIVRHSGASEVSLQMSCDEGGLSIVIEDNGKGMQLGQQSPGKDGILNIRNRIEGLGGTFDLESKAGKGTRVRLHLPLSSTTLLKP